MSTVLQPSSTTAGASIRLPSAGNNVTDNILGSGGDYSAFCDPNSVFYDPVLCLQLQGGGGTSVNAGGNSGGDVNVTVNQSVTVANNIGAELAAAINSAMLKAAQAANSIALDTSNQVAQTLNNTTTGILNGVNSAFGSLGDFFKNLLNSLGSGLADIFKSIVSNIGSIASQVASAVTNAIGPVVSAIGQVLQTVQTTYSQYIQPVLTLVQSTIQTIGALTTAIERDLSNGIQGILQLPGDIANGLGSLDATLQRTAQQLGINLDSTIGVNLKYGTEDTVWSRIKGLHTALGSVPGESNVGIAFKDHVGLAEPGLLQASQQLVAAFEKNLSSMMGQLGPVADKFIKDVASNVSDAGTFLNGAVAAGLWVVFAIFASVGEVYPMLKFLTGYTQSQLPLEKLDLNSALTAWVRGYIDSGALAQELGFAGLDATRIKTLQDLQVYLVGIHDSIDMWFRGIVNDSELSAALAQHGVSIDDQDALKAASYKKVSVEIANIGRRWGLIDDAQWESTYKALAYTDDEIALSHDTLYALESQEQVQLRLRIQQLYAELGFSPANLSAVPADVIAAAARDSNSPQVALDQWQRQFYVPSIDTWIELYFRGIRTQSELTAAMNYWMVPEQLRDDLVQARKALIPFRTIPTMLANGIINEPYAKSQLQAHGFDLVATEALLKYATVAHAKSKTALLGDPLQTSVTAAHELWSIGAFTDAQFAQTLTAHGFTDTQATTIIQSDKLAAEAKDRKALANDIVNEVLAGLLTIDDAKTLMAQQQFTIPESARVLKSISKTQRATSKTPAEAELTKMMKAHAITFSDWSSAMSVNGFAQKWIDAFALLNFGSVNGPSTIASGT